MLNYDGANERYVREIFHKFCIKKCVFIVSDNIQPVALPPDDSNTYEGEIALLSGIGKTA
jgi:hypothetical protein